MKFYALGVSNVRVLCARRSGQKDFMRYRTGLLDVVDLKVLCARLNDCVDNRNSIIID